MPLLCGQIQNGIYDDKKYMYEKLIANKYDMYKLSVDLYLYIIIYISNTFLNKELTILLVKHKLLIMYNETLMTTRNKCAFMITF